MDVAAQPSLINGHRVVSESDFESDVSGEKYFAIAIGDHDLRKHIAETCLAKGYKPFTLIAKNALIYDDVNIASGSIICANCVLTSNISIGSHVHLNLGSYVAHDCLIGNYVTFAPGVKCNGHVQISDGAYIGTGAIIRPGVSGKPLVIGENSIVGMGAVVTKDVPAHTTVVGNPARPIERK